MRLMLVSHVLKANDTDNSPFRDKMNSKISYLQKEGFTISEVTIEESVIPASATEVALVRQTGAIYYEVTLA